MWKRWRNKICGRPPQFGDKNQIQANKDYEAEWLGETNIEVHERWNVRGRFIERFFICLNCEARIYLPEDYEVQCQCGELYAHEGDETEIYHII